MSRVIIVVLLVGLLGFAGCAGNSVCDLDNADRSVSEVTFGSSWNTHCSSCSFDTNAAATFQTTLGDMYNGATFEIDIAQMDRLISIDLGAPSGLEGADYNALYIWYDDDGDDLD